MASGRMIANAIAGDKRVNNLSDDTSRLAFTWLITFADCEGRTHGDPAMVKSLVFPRRQDVTVEQVESYIREWASAELIYWYETEGDMWIQFVQFEKNQPGLRKDREAPSRIPPYAEELRINSDNTPDQLPVKLKEIKRIEVKEGATPAFIPPTPEERIYCAVTNHPAIPAAEADSALDRIAKLKRANGFDDNQTVEYLRPYWKAQHQRYPASTKTFWLDWALIGTIPDDKRPPVNGGRKKLDY